MLRRGVQQQQQPFASFLPLSCCRSSCHTRSGCRCSRRRRRRHRRRRVVVMPVDQSGRHAGRKGSQCRRQPAIPLFPFTAVLPLCSCSLCLQFPNEWVTNNVKLLVSALFIGVNQVMRTLIVAADAVCHLTALIPRLLQRKTGRQGTRAWEGR